MGEPARKLSLADALRIARERKGWSKKELERRSGISRRTIIRIESGEYTGDDILPRTLAKIAKALGEPLEVLRTDPQILALAHMIEHMDPERRALMYDIMRLPKEKQKAVLKMLEGLYDLYGPAEQDEKDAKDKI